MSEYVDYYRRAVLENSAGLKLVIGGTGLGKTSAIPKVVRDLPQDRKAIYIANRIHLLDEMVRAQDGFSAAEVAFLRRDLDTVLKTLADMGNELDEFIDDKLFTTYAHQRIDTAQLKRACSQLQETHEPRDSSFVPSLIEEKVEELARYLLAQFKIVLLAAKRDNDKHYNQLLDHPVVQSLFPFIRFVRRPEVRILLLTLHKAFYGFFDGSQTRSLSALSGYVVFLDEFDFLENDLIGLICRSPQIYEPFQFVEFFYEQMRRHKLALEGYPVSGGVDIRRRLLDIYNQIDSLHQEGIRFPEINQFTCRASEISAAVFRTSHTVATGPLFLCQTQRAFEILLERDAECDGISFHAYQLLATVSSVSERILTLLKALETDDPPTYRDLVRDCYRSTTFEQQLSRISQLPRKRHRQLTQLGSLLESGYSLFDIRQLSKSTDPEEVELRHYAIYTTPEKLIATLAAENLVFGLSATADIPRCLHHFDLRWLDKQESVNFIPIDDYDRAIVSELNAEKASWRSNQVSVVRLPSLDAADPLDQALRNYLTFLAGDERFGEETRGGHLKQRVERFFASMIWASNRPDDVKQTDSHLVFLNTFRQVKFAFEQAAGLSSDLFEVNLREEGNPFSVYDIQFNKQDFIVVFYNAKLARELRTSRAMDEHFNTLFWEGVPVVVVTQYLSAGNGVNLQYRPSPDSTIERRDFINLHLLEVPYYYFSPVSGDQMADEQAAIIKENAWYLAKLHAAKLISESEFRARLSKLHTPIEWNSQYQQHPYTQFDYTLNSVAALTQALGRSERVWKPMPDQSVVMSDDVHLIFQRYMIDPRFEFIREQRRPIVSENLSQVLAQIEVQSTAMRREISQRADARLEQVNARCRKGLLELVDQFQSVRQDTESSDVRRVWAQLRRAALHHDFANDLLRKHNCVFESPYVQTGTVFLSREGEVVPPGLTHPDVAAWRLNSLYDVICENENIRKHFQQRGYELSFSLEGSAFFVPYFYQAVLSGAIGEEAISALLKAGDINLEELPDTLFEITDLKVEGLPWYVDCKNYSEFTLDRFSLQPDDPLYHPKLNEAHFKARAIKKWREIAGYEGPGSRLIYINLATAHERPLSYYSENFTPVDTFEKARIIVSQGAVNSQEPDELHPEFGKLLCSLWSAQRG